MQTAIAHDGRPLRLRDWLLIATVVIVGTAASCVTWYLMTRAEHRLADQEFTGRAANVSSLMETGVADYLEKIEALRAFFDVDRLVTRGEFETFGNSLLRNHDAILNVSWIPRVTRAERAEHELAADRDGMTNYRIRVLPPDYRMITAPELDEYYPKYYSTEARTSPVYGLNLIDLSDMDRAIERARDGNLLSSTPVIDLLIGRGNKKGFVVLQPVYKHGLPYGTVDERQANIAGLVQGVFQIEVLFDAVVGARKAPLHAYLFAPFAGLQDLPVYHRSILTHSTIDPKSRATLVAGAHRSFPLAIGDRSWTIVITPAFAETGRIRIDQSDIVLFSGLLLTLVLTAFMTASRRYALRLETANDRIAGLARTDPLTGLANRRGFSERVANHFALAKRGTAPFALHYLDLDHFKEVNDELGHPIGDILLQQVAERINKVLRESDVAARFGGDEFAVLQTNVNAPSDAAMLAAKITAALATPFAIEHNKIQISASVGISLFGADASSFEIMMEQADEALYRAKQEERNCFRFHDKDIEARFRAENRISDATQPPTDSAAVTTLHPRTDATGSQPAAPLKPVAI